MSALLDVNVLIALIDPAHVGHEAAHQWFEARDDRSFATCPLTENGVLRIVGHIKYPNTPGSPATVTAIIAGLRALPGHVFWPDDLSLVAADHIDCEEILTSAQVTDTYLLALAVAKKGRLATFDRRLSTKAVRGGKSALEIIDA